MQARLDRIAHSVTNVPIRRTVDTGAPIASFVHTDFVTAITPDLVEDMAMCLAGSGIPFPHCDVIVSVADRISGSLTHAVSRITGRPYTLANWYPPRLPWRRGNTTFAGVFWHRGCVFEWSGAWHEGCVH